MAAKLRAIATASSGVSAEEAAAAIVEVTRVRRASTISNPLDPSAVNPLSLTAEAATAAAAAAAAAVVATSASAEATEDDNNTSNSESASLG